MKALLLFLFVIFTFSSCKKDNTIAATDIMLYMKEAYVGDEIQVIGKQFDPEAKKNIVVFSGGKEVAATSVVDGYLVVSVPEGAVSGPLYVKKGKKSSPLSTAILIRRKYKWQTLAPFPGVGRICAVGFSVNGKGYITTGATKYSGTFPKDMWEYDPATNNWTRKADFPGNARYFSFSFVVDKKAYVGGGITNIPYDGTRDLYQYDPATDKWTQMASIPNTDSFTRSTAVNLDGNGFVINEGNKHGVWRYNTASNTWTLLNNANIYVPWASIISQGISFVAEGKVHYGFGVSNLSSPPQPSNGLHSYDATKNEWTYVNQQIDPGSGLQALGNTHFFDGNIYASFDDYGTLNRYDPLNKRWSRFYTGPLNIKSDAAYFTIGSTAYVFGGHAGFYDLGSNQLYGFNMDPYIR